MPAPCDEIMEKRQATDRRVSKPLMEKRRRARINHCLSQLKGLVVDRTKSESPRPTKLEKADILELTVRHLNDIKQRHRTETLVNDPNLRRKFQIGFEECAREVDSFLSSIEEGMVSEVKRRLKLHLLRRLSDINESDQTSDLVDEVSSSNCSFETDQPGAHPDDNGQLSPSSTFRDATATEMRKASLEELSLIPRRLPNGDVALVLPPQVFAAGSVSCPLSAFRIVCSGNATESDASTVHSKQNEIVGHRIEWSPSPSLSSAVSDLSGDDEFHHVDIPFNDHQNDSSSKNFVWRPW